MRDPATFETRLTAAYRRFADEVSTDVDALALARSITTRPVRTALVVPRLRPLRLAVVLSLLTVVAIAATVVVGGQPSTVPSVAPAATPVAAAATIAASGTTDTAIGQLSWTKVRGDASNIPFDRIFQTPGGFAVIEPDLDAQGSRFWVSTDGIDWVVAPMPVPATGVAVMGQTPDEYWIWSGTDFRLWRSSDFDTWTEVALDEVRPPVIADVDWELGFSDPVTVGTTTLLPWHAYGKLAVDDLLGITLAPGETLTTTKPNDPRPAPGERDIYRARSDGHVKVGSIRVEVDGSLVTVYDAASDDPLTRIDASIVGIPPADLAHGLDEDLSVGIDSVVVIKGGDAQRVASPPGGFAELAALDGRFIALSGKEQESVWASTNGIDWESLSPLTFPSSFGTHSMDLLEGPARDADEPLIAAVRITEDEDTQRTELWSSTDGQTWMSLGLVSTYPGTGLEPMRAPTGYLATGEDYRIRVSATGAGWELVDGPHGVRREGFRNSSTSAAVFTLESMYDGTRALWMFRVDPAATPSPSP